MDSAQSVSPVVAYSWYVAQESWFVAARAKQECHFSRYQAHSSRFVAGAKLVEQHERADAVALHLQPDLLFHLDLIFSQPLRATSTAKASATCCEEDSPIFICSTRSTSAVRGHEK